MTAEQRRQAIDFGKIRGTGMPIPMGIIPVASRAHVLNIYFEVLVPAPVFFWRNRNLVDSSWASKGVPVSAWGRKSAPTTAWVEKSVPSSTWKGKSLPSTPWRGRTPPPDGSTQEI